MRVLIAGPPAAGKTTLARQLAKIHDATVIDFDQIATELGSGSAHDHGRDVRRATHDEIDRRLDALTGPAIVIRSAPTRTEREAIAHRIGADRVIVLDLPADEAKRRAVAAERPDWTADAIDSWWQRYEPDESPPVPRGGERTPPSSRDGSRAQPTGESAEMADDPAGDPPADTPDAPDPETEPDPPKDDKLPPEIQEILTKERKAARDAAREAKTAKSALANATSELEKFREAQLTEQEKAIKTAREEALAEGLKVGNQRLIRAEIISAAAGKVADPDDAYAILTASGALNGLEVDGDGNVDTAFITTAVDDLVKAKPHLAAVRSPSFGTRAPAQTPTGETDMDAFIRGARG